MIEFVKSIRQVLINRVFIAFQHYKNSQVKYQVKNEVPTYIINLEHRVDRIQRTQEVLSNYPLLKTQITKAIKYDPGYIGCTLSHIKAIQHAIAEKHNYCIVCEDDIELNLKEEELNKLLTVFLESRFKILCIGNTNAKVILNSKSLIAKAYNIQTTACYVIKSEYYSKILRSFQRSLENQLKGCKDDYCAIDQGWKSLQLRGKFCVPTDKLCHQRESFSDIEKRIVDYSNEKN